MCLCECVCAYRSSLDLLIAKESKNEAKVKRDTNKTVNRHWIAAAKIKDGALLPLLLFCTALITDIDVTVAADLESDCLAYEHHTTQHNSQNN